MKARRSIPQGLLTFLAPTAHARRRWRVWTAHARVYLEASALIALAVATGAWLAKVL
jgi:hypothetical protein